MKPYLSHRWDVPEEKAIAIQRRLAGDVSLAWEERTVERVAGIDVGFARGKGQAAAAVLSFPHLQLVDSARVEMEVSFPYIPGLLAFREGPLVLAALERLSVEPDLLICDGHGLAHPRRMGLATHIGVLLDVPSIGCAKSRLVGAHQEPGPRKGSYAWLYDGGEVIGAVLRTRDGVKPVYVSIGHRIDLERAIEFVLRCCTKYRLPEPIRWAHRLASEETPPQGQQLSLF